MRLEDGDIDFIFSVAGRGKIAVYDGDAPLFSHKIRRGRRHRARRERTMARCRECPVKPFKRCAAQCVESRFYEEALPLYSDISETHIEGIAVRLLETGRKFLLRKRPVLCGLRDKIGGEFDCGIPRRQAHARGLTDADGAFDKDGYGAPCRKQPFAETGIHRNIYAVSLPPCARGGQIKAAPAPRKRAVPYGAADLLFSAADDLESVAVGGDMRRIHKCKFFIFLRTGKGVPILSPACPWISEESRFLSCPKT